MLVISLDDWNFAVASTFRARVPWIYGVDADPDPSLSIVLRTKICITNKIISWLRDSCVLFTYTGTPIGEVWGDWEKGGFGGRERGLERFKVVSHR